MIKTAYRKTGAWDLTGTLARPYKTWKTRTWDPTKTGKLGPETLVGPYKNGKPEPRTLVGPYKNWNAGS